jgi:tetratricopeptide (TPR) repeat protein
MAARAFGCGIGRNISALVTGWLALIEILKNSQVIEQILSRGGEKPLDKEQSTVLEQAAASFPFSAVMAQAIILAVRELEGAATMTFEKIHTKVDRIWTLIDEAYIDEAYTVAENLIVEASQRTGASDVQTLHTLARMYHAAAHATSLSLKTEEVGQILYYYQQMEHFARQVKDDTLVNISLAYQGDMFRRKGDIPHAIQYLERARDTTPQADEAARGNALQLLARTYIQGQRLENFDRTIKEAEDLAYAIDQQNNSVRQFNLGYVFEEYAKSYGRPGKTQLALDYIDRAEKYRTPTKSSEILMKVARAEILVREGDVRNAVPLAAEAAIYSREHGHNRRLERIYAIKRYIHQQATKYGKAEWELNEALEGPNEY